MSATAGEIIDFNTEDREISPLEQSFQGWKLHTILKDVMDTPFISNFYAETIEPLEKTLQKAYEQKNSENYDAALQKLTEKLNPNDPSLLQYKLKNCNLFFTITFSF